MDCRIGWTCRGAGTTNICNCVVRITIPCCRVVLTLRSLPLSCSATFKPCCASKVLQSYNYTLFSAYLCCFPAFLIPIVLIPLPRGNAFHAITTAIGYRLWSTLAGKIHPELSSRVNNHLLVLGRCLGSMCM